MERIPGPKPPQIVLSEDERVELELLSEIVRTTTSLPIVQKQAGWSRLQMA